MNIRMVAVPLLLSISLHAQAADPARDVRQSAGRNSAYAEIGFGVVTTAIPLVGFNETSLEESADPIYSLDIALDGRVQYKGFFAETVEDSFSNVTLGYSVYDNVRGSFELIATELIGAIEYNDISGLESVKNRKGDINLGVRASRFFDNKLIQLELVANTTDAHNGIVGAVHVGQSKQVQNWNFYGLAGLRYFSDDVIDHILGVSADEATEALPEYQGKAGFMPSIQLGAVLPISENWTLNMQAEYALFPDSAADSPLAQGRDMYIGRIGVNYILFN